ncbi:MAG: amylo-alpha-1,6-glucosidase [Tepidisphaeraceae bacterium]
MQSKSLNDDRREWLETDGLGGFASGTVGGVRTRRYHALLLASDAPPTSRFVLVNGFEATVHGPNGNHSISAQRYAGAHGDAPARATITSFTDEPWPTWRYELPDGIILEQELFVVRGSPTVCVSWRKIAGPDAELRVRPLMSGRDYHALHHENDAFRFEPEHSNGVTRWRPYEGVPHISVKSNGRLFTQPIWYRQFFYEEEEARGFDAVEDCASPGVYRFDLAQREAVLILTTDAAGSTATLPGGSAEESIEMLRDVERRRRRGFATRLHRSADQYLVRRGRDQTSVSAGYPWFADWGRDTLIALRGLSLATGRHDVARDVLLSWSQHVSQGLLPNRFPDSGAEPEYNSVDAALWFVVDVCELLDAADEGLVAVTPPQRRQLFDATDAILTAYAAGTRHGIRRDADGLLACGAPGTQLTWMDARADGREVTPRIGKPVEVQALWLNALHLAGKRIDRHRQGVEKALRSFRSRFWNVHSGCLFDVVDVDHVAGRDDATVRPNQVFAAGGLPLALLGGDRAKRVLAKVEAELWTPLGLRSLSPSDPPYAGRYEGGPIQRDASYHQGTVWPWLIGPFVEAWVRAFGRPEEARRRFLFPLIDHLHDAGIGHVSEIADGDAPHAPRGCPFQAWSVAELLRVSNWLEAFEAAPRDANRSMPARHLTLA